MDEIQDPVSHADKVVEKADQLQDRISAETDKVIRDLVAYKAKATKWQRINSIIIAVLVVMFVGGTFLLIKIRDNAATIQAACESGNRARAGETKLWDFILSLPIDPNQTQQEQEARIALQKLVDDIFASRDCSNPQVLP